MTLTRTLAVALAVAAGALGVWRGTWAVGGSDSSCYALMAQAFATGQIQPRSALADEAPWPGRGATFAPGGFIPSPISENAAAPVCAPGFAALLAPLYMAGGRDAIFLLTPAAGALLIYATFVFGRRMASDSVGLAAALITVTMPVFVFQIVQPMNDVVVAAVWTAIVATAVRPHREPALLGALTGLALFIRPNLAPAAVVVAVWTIAGGWRSIVRFSVAFAPFLIALLTLTWSLYGHPFRSGYGNVDELFSTAYIAANLRNYGSALVGTQLGFPLLGLMATFFVPPARRSVAALATSISAAVIFVYLLYRPLPEWWYLRFLLPVLPMLVVLALAMLVSISRRRIALVPVVLVLVAYAVMTDAMREALDLGRLERRFRTAGIVARERFADNAVFLSVWESGSVRYHADREALVWDSLPAERLDAAIDWLSSEGRDPHILIEDWEEPLFRERFAAHSGIGQLDWPPRFEIERRVKIYRPADRARYISGESIPTEFVLPNRR